MVARLRHFKLFRSSRQDWVRVPSHVLICVRSSFLLLHRALYTTLYSSFELRPRVAYLGTAQQLLLLVEEILAILGRNWFLRPQLPPESERQQATKKQGAGTADVT